MTDKTLLFFGSYGEPAYPGAGSKPVEPEKAHHWHVTVGGSTCRLTKENIGTYMPRFLDLAYDAGVADEKRRIAKLLGVKP